MAGMLALVLINVLISLPVELGKAKASKSFGELFAKSRAINLLAGARIFLFGSRDVWFVVGLPVFSTPRAGNSPKWRVFSPPGRSVTASYKALRHPSLRRSPDGLSREIPEARIWGAVLTAIPVAIALLLQSQSPPV